MPHQNDEAGRREPDAGDSATPPDVVADPDIMGGWPCFTGTRVPASMVLEIIDNGTPWARLIASYPFLTGAHVAAARAFVASPDGRRKGQPWLSLGTAVCSKVVRPARCGTKPESEQGPE